MNFPPVLAARLSAWGKLLRVPNLFSVPGDTLAGFLIAGGLLTAQPFEIISVCAAGFFAYLCGLLGNDIADLETDRAERPTRPLPSGAVSMTSAKTAMALCALLAVVPAAYSVKTGTTALLLLLCVMLYNFKLKGRKIAGPVSMGACRFFNVLLGIAAVRSPDTLPCVLAFLFAFGEFLYIAGVTLAAADETKKLAKRPGGTLFFTGAVLAYLTLFVRLGLLRMGEWFDYIPGLLSAFAAAVFLVIAWKGFRTFARPSLPGIAQGWIGALIGNLIFLQTAGASASGAILIAGLLLGFWFCARALAVHFYGS